jgi:hypothetical protein
MYDSDGNVEFLLKQFPDKKPSRIKMVCYLEMSNQSLRKERSLRADATDVIKSVTRLKHAGEDPRNWCPIRKMRLIFMILSQ